MDSRYKIMFLRGVNNFPVGCLAFSYTKSASNTSTIQYQISTLNPCDAFDRRVARQLAIGRVIERPISIQIDNNISYNEMVKRIMIDMVNRSEVPNRSRSAAVKWLNTNPKNK